MSRVRTRKRPVDPRLFKPPGPAKQLTSKEDVFAFFRELARRSAEASPQANLDLCRRYAEQILSEAAAHDEAKELARGVLGLLQTVDALMSRGANADAINAGMLLGAKFEAMRLSRIFAAGVDGARRVRGGGGKGGAARHQAEKHKITKRWDTLEAKAKTLNAAGRERTSILDELEKLGAKNGVKRSTIEKNPRIRKHLPSARRKPSR